MADVAKPWWSSDRHPLAFRTVGGVDLCLYERPAGSEVWTLTAWDGRTQAEVFAAAKESGDSAAVVMVQPGEEWDPPESGTGERAPTPPPKLEDSHG